MKLRPTFLKTLGKFCLGALFFAIFLTTIATAAYAAPGEIDSGFGINGSVLTEFERGVAAQVVLVQPDQKVIIAGTTMKPDLPDATFFTVLRFNADGSPDLSFGTDGQVFTSILSRNGAQAGVLQADGKFIIAGHIIGNLPGNKIGLVRYNPDGSLDLSFGDNGKVISDFNVSSAVNVHTLLIQPDGKIVAVGDNESFDIFLSRYDSNGVLDSSFGNGGKVITRYVNEGNQAKSALLQPDGKIVVGGWINTSDSASNSALFRYNADGTPDNSFDNDGVAINALSSSHDRVNRVLLRPDGKILTVGIAVNSQQNTHIYALTLFNSDGTLDLTYGTKGTALLPAIGFISIEGALLQTDGKIVIAGSYLGLFSSRQRIHLVRFNGNGSFDFTFGNGGRVNFPIGYSSRGYALAIQNDSKILVAGGGTTLSSRKAIFALTRFQGGNSQIPASAFISGRVVNDNGERGIGGVLVKLSGGTLTAPRYTRTNPFGFYRFSDVLVNAEYDLTVIGKYNSTSQTSVHLLLNGNEYAEDLLYQR